MREHITLEELIAVILRVAPDSHAVKEITARYNTARSLHQASKEELMAITGISGSKATQLKAAMELGLRIATAPHDNKQSLTSPSDVYQLLLPKLQFLDREHFLVVLVNTKNRVITIDTVSIGALSSSIVHPREVFKNAIKVSAAAIILAHNHPSGDPTPSREDLEVTKRIVQAGEIIGIRVLDHIVIGDSGFFSFKEKGLV